jgi:hypothetical protein
MDQIKMEQININKILEREKITECIKQHICKKDTPGIYIYGDYGIGKTHFVVQLLKEMGYDVLVYDTNHVRNAAFFHEISKNGISNKNVTSMFHKKSKEVVLVMDEIDGMIANDKGGISALIKLIQPTKKIANATAKHLPIFCIASNKTNKKVKDLMKVCKVFELQKPSCQQMHILLAAIIPENTSDENSKIIEMVQGDLRKLCRFIEIYHKSKSGDKISQWIDNIHTKYSNDDAKTVVKKLMDTPGTLQEHVYINESDRSIIGLLWHENIVDLLAKMDKKKSIPFYIRQLENICFSDYIERITFQKQIWQLNEMCSLIKTMYNNKLLFDEKKNGLGVGKEIKEIRFTKILTKYSTEYNNSLFLYHLCQLLGYDISDLLVYFSTIDATGEQELLKHIEITKLDIKRMQRFIEKYTKENAIGIKEVDIKEVDCDDDTVCEGGC